MSEPDRDRCNLLAVVATTVGAPEHVGWASDLSLQVDAVSAGTGHSRLHEKSLQVAISVIRWCQLARSAFAQFQVTTACR